jgi:hypothetical protein
MADINAAADIDTDEDAEPAEETQAQKKEPLTRGRKEDPFGAAFEAAEKEVEGEPAPKKPAKAAKVKAQEPDDEDEPEEKPKPAKKPAAKDAKAKEQAEKGDEEPDDADAESDDEDEDEEADDEAKAKADAKAKKAEKLAAEKAKKPLAAKQWWSKERREAFAYQPRHVQETWLEEAPVPDVRWPDEQKAAFAKLPREGQEMYLTQAKELERGYNDKFQSLAGERKAFEAIKNAVTPEMRALMEQRKLDEPAVFKRLMDLQLQSMKDPYGYIKSFIDNNRLDLRHIYPAAAGDTGEDQQHASPRTNMQQPADITSHPVVHALLGEINTLKEAVMSDRQQRELEGERRRADEVNKAVTDKDEEGNSRYPYIRILSGPMAEIIESDPERFSSMGVKEQIAESYRLALDAYPELTPPKPSAPPPKIDESEDEDAEAEKEDESAKLKKAATKKSKAPQTAPTTGGDPFERAFSKASRQIGQR